MKRQSTEWEKTLANHVTDKVLISKMYKQLIQLNIHKKSPKISRKPKLTFFQRRYTDGKQAHEKVFNIVNY